MLLLAALEEGLPAFLRLADQMLPGDGIPQLLAVIHCLLPVPPFGVPELASTPRSMDVQWDVVLDWPRLRGQLRAGPQTPAIAYFMSCHSSLGTGCQLNQLASEMRDRKHRLADLEENARKTRRLTGATRASMSTAASPPQEPAVRCSHLHIGSTTSTSCWSFELDDDIMPEFIQRGHFFRKASAKFGDRQDFLDWLEQRWHELDDGRGVPWAHAQLLWGQLKSHPARCDRS